jgi:hypothetical protein
MKIKIMGLFSNLLHFKTDDFKWYGVVEYNAPLSQISSIRTELDWRSVEGHHIHCDFLDKSLSSYRKLNSKCLFVDNLPKEFTNTSEFRDIFSAVSSPLYCQVCSCTTRETVESSHCMITASYFVFFFFLVFFFFWLQTFYKATLVVKDTKSYFYTFKWKTLNKCF